MTKSFLALSIVLIIACSNNDLGGYTESIIKKTNSLEQKNPSAKAEPIPEEDLSSLDEESLSQKLINTYPWPKPKAEPLVGSFEGPHNPYDGEILKFTWRENNPVFAEAPNYEYGFDRDPTDQDPIVYISLEKTPSPLTITKKARFIPHLPNTTYEKYSLLHEDAGENQATVASLGIPITNNTENYLDKEGTYTLFGCWLACDGPSILQFWKNLEKKITIKVYQHETREISYIELNGDGKNLDASTDNSIYTKARVKEHINDVFKQAVLAVEPKEIKAKELDNIEVDKITKEEFLKHYDDIVNLDDLIEVDLTKPNNDFLGTIELKIVEYLKKNKIKPLTEPLYSKYWRYVFVINKERKKWTLEKCIGEDGSLNACPYFKPHQEPSNVSYQRYGCNTSGNPENVTIIRTKKSSGYIYQIKNSKGKIVSKEDCLGILFTDNGYPVFPNADQSLAAGFYPFSKFYFAFVNETNFNTFDFPNLDSKLLNYLSYGGAVIQLRNVGESSQYTLVHEIGHSFGLTDVGQSNLYYIQEYDKTYNEPFKVNYASSETNLMSWESPTGKKIRTRDTPIACSGGTRHYYEYNGGKNRIYLEFFERLVEGKGENQWDCLRDCYKKPNSYNTTNRLLFWNNTERCSPEESGVKHTSYDIETIKKLQSDKENELNSKHINKEIYTESEKENLK